MRLNKPAKIVLGIITFLPVILVVGTILISIYQVFSFLFSDDPAMPMFLFPYLGYVLPYIFFFFLFYIGLGIFYFIHIAQNNSLDYEKKFLWIVVLIILNGIAMPVYWCIHIWNDKTSEPKSSFDQIYESGTEPEKF